MNVLIQENFVTGKFRGEAFQLDQLSIVYFRVHIVMMSFGKDNWIRCLVLNFLSITVLCKIDRIGRSVIDLC